MKDSSTGLWLCCNVVSILFILTLSSVKVNCDLVDGLNVVDMKLRQGLLSRTSQFSVPVRDRNKAINVTLGMELKKIVDVSNAFLGFFSAMFLWLACVPQA